MQEPILDGMAQTERDRPEPLLRPGNTNCGGCGMSMSLNMLSHAVCFLFIFISWFAYSELCLQYWVK